MSKETRTWLSENTLIGFTDKRGHAWHHREGDHNSYRGAIPIEDVHRRLFDWTAEKRPLYVGVPESDGWMEKELIPGRKAIVRSDTGHVMGIFKNGYQPHQFGQWLVEYVAGIINGTLQIASAGLLKGGAVAWVSVEIPENMITPEGVEFRPGLLARASFDGSIASTYGRHITKVVCDNTLAAAAREHGGRVYKVKSTKNSLADTKLKDIREAVGLVEEIEADFREQVRYMTGIKFGTKTFERILDDLVPLPEPGKKKAATLASAKRDKLWDLWTQDERVAPWTGTAYGAWMAFNTYGQHEGHVRGMTRQERNMLNAVNGTIETTDTETVRRILALAA